MTKRRSSRLQLYRKFLRQRYNRWRKKPLARRLQAYGNDPQFAQSYLVGCLVVLGATTALWALLGAWLQQDNADQVVNAYLFEDGSSFHGAAWPAQHSFLFKWPLFFLAKLLGYSQVSFIGLTLLTVLLTVGTLAFILSRIERRPIVLGSLFLALASIMLLIPAQPYAGGLLPVNMAMLTTRNLEYVLYIASLYCIVKTAVFKSWQFWLGVGLLTLLMASDRLFLSMSIGGAVVALVVYALRQRLELVSVSVRWLLASAAAGVGSIGVIAAINAGHITHIVSQTLAGPYGAAHGVKSVFEGAFYAVAGLVTNFGANPAYNSRTIRQIPQYLITNLLQPAGFAYLVNLVLFVGIASVSWIVLKRSVWPPTRNAQTAGSSIKLAILLLWSTLAAIGLFIVSNHYYVVDARYLTIALFTGLVVLAVWTSGKRRIHHEVLLLALPIFVVSILSGWSASALTHQAQKQALSDMQRRDKLIVKTIASHKVKVLVGDYWRVIPVKSLTHNKQTVLPLASCNEARTVLTSQAWQPDLHHRSFAYLLTFDGSLTDYPHCTLPQVIKTYGLPNSSALIEGSLADPKEILLFYDQGIHVSLNNKRPLNDALATVIPISLADLSHTTCPVPTIMNIVAHQDDDLLFMNPDLLHSVRSGHCIRTVYLTAGDAGANAPYWLAREQGSEAAYQEMIGHKTTWIQRQVRLPGGQYVTIASPQGDNRFSLIFMHLPDGNLRGEGFTASHYQSLAGLLDGHHTALQTVDQQSHFTAGQLVDGLTELFHTYQPAVIRTQSNYGGSQFTDHSDHRATGQFVVQAHKKYQTQQFAGYVNVPLVFYKGYPIHEQPPNLAGRDLADKTAAFLAYAAFDGGVCHSIEECSQVSTYGSYINRQYTNPY